MTIVFSASVGSHDKDRELLVTRLIPEFITKLGHDVKILTYDPSNPTDHAQFDVLAEKIISADAYIGEMSRASQTLGFQLSFALANTKPSLYLYAAGTNARPGTILSQNPSRLLKIKTYNQGTYKKVLTAFLAFAEHQQRTTRTSFVSTKRIDQFITEFAAAQNISKGEAIRQLLDKAIQ